MIGSRALAALVALVAAVAAPLAGSHIHDYADHDHPEHHHGPAVHSHERDRLEHSAGTDGHPALAPCDPAGHEVAVQAAYGAATNHHAPLPTVLESRSFSSALRLAVPIRLADVRVHGPPGQPQTSPRPPPVVHPA